MIKQIVHISDIHIRTYQLHNLFKNHFYAFLDDIAPKLEGLKAEEVRFVITGDLFHQKINVSNEQIVLMSWFLKELMYMGHVVIIPGNHDFLENNKDRLDSITPIIELLENEPIKYYRDSGLYQDDNINWVVYSLYQGNERPKFEHEDGKFHIGLFHGPIQGLKTDLGHEFKDGYDTLNFLGLDFVLCGDIHKRQTFELRDGTPGIMVGSFIQQNFSETVQYHGYGMLDVEKKEYEFYDLPPIKPFLHFKITDITDIENESEQLLNFS